MSRRKRQTESEREMRYRGRNANRQLWRTDRRVDRQKLMPACHPRVSVCLYTPCDLCAAWDVGSRGGHRGQSQDPCWSREGRWSPRKTATSCCFLHVYGRIHTEIKSAMTFSSRRTAKRYMSHRNVLPLKSLVFKQTIVLSVLALILLRVEYHNCVIFAKQL